MGMIKTNRESNSSFTQCINTFNIFTIAGILTLLATDCGIPTEVLTLRFGQLPKLRKLAVVNVRFPQGLWGLGLGRLPWVEEMAKM